MDTAERLSVLKKYEQDCYSICYYLLQCEQLACEAAKNALMELFQNDSFFDGDVFLVNDILRQESVKAALRTKHVMT